jgi:hypothetical protein
MRGRRRHGAQAHRPPRAAATAALSGGGGGGGGGGCGGGSGDSWVSAEDADVDDGDASGTAGGGAPGPARTAALDAGPSCAAGGGRASLSPRRAAAGPGAPWCGLAGGWRALGGRLGASGSRALSSVSERRSFGISSLPGLALALSLRGRDASEQKPSWPCTDIRLGFDWSPFLH